VLRFGAGGRAALLAPGLAHVPWREAMVDSIQYLRHPVRPRTPAEIEASWIEAVDRAAVRYDRQGDQHYDVISAFIKSVRGSDVDAALHYLARMVEAGEDPRFIARRLVRFASEDIGNADPQALAIAVAAKDAVHFIGMPEGNTALAQAATYLATAPKSNRRTQIGTTTKMTKATVSARMRAASFAPAS